MARSWQHFRDEVDLAAHATRRAEERKLRPGSLALVLQPLLRLVLPQLGGLVRKRLYAYGDIFATRRPPRFGHRGLERKRARLGSLTLTLTRTPNPNPDPNPTTLIFTRNPNQFAHAANKAVGDGKLITITGNMYSMQDHHLHMPFNEHISARGYPSVLIDMYSYFPFSDNTFDLVHSSWAYHDGFPRATLHEITRVLRPGGWLVLRSMNDWTLNEVIQFATDYAWPFCAKNSQLGVPRSYVNGEVLWCQVPTYHGSSSATATA